MCDTKVLVSNFAWCHFHKEALLYFLSLHSRHWYGTIKQYCCSNVMSGAHCVVLLWSLPWVVEWMPFNQPWTPLVPETPVFVSEWKGWLTAAGFSITDNVSPLRLYKKYSVHIRSHLQLFSIWQSFGSHADHLALNNSRPVGFCPI